MHLHAIQLYELYDIQERDGEEYDDDLEDSSLDNIHNTVINSITRLRSTFDYFALNSRSRSRETIIRIYADIINEYDDLEDVLVTLSESAFSQLETCEYDPEKCKDQSACPICLETYQSDKSIQLIKLKCKHLFHNECIKPWLTLKSTKCPVCRKEQRNEN